MPDAAILFSMRILRVTSLGYEAGGAENGIVLANAELKRRGHTVRTLASDSCPGAPHFNEYSFPALSAQPAYRKPFYGFFYPASYRALKRALAEYRPDIVHVHTTFELSPSVFFALRRVPAVLTIHGAEDFTRLLMVWAFPLTFFRGGVVDRMHLTLRGWVHYAYHRFLNGPFYRFAIARFVDCVIVLSRAMHQMFLREGLATTCVMNATRLFNAVPMDEECATVLYVGRLEKIKGVQNLVAALPALLRSCPSASLEIAGIGSYEEDLRALANELGVSTRVSFLGKLSREELGVRYARAALVVVPSVWPEPFGKVGIEAMSVGRPVVASDVGGVREWLVHGKSGFLVPPGDVNALARAQATLLLDTKLRAECGTYAAEYAKRFSIERHVSAMLELYEGVIQSSPKNR